MAGGRRACQLALVAWLGEAGNKLTNQSRLRRASFNITNDRQLAMLAGTRNFLGLKGCKSPTTS
jgi:hypothetical protein